MGKSAKAGRRGRSRPEKPSPAAPGGLREAHKRDKRERLRKAAWELFTTKGYEETTTRAIAERARVAAGTVFLYAKDKQDLLFLVMEERLARCTDDAFRTLPEGAPLEEQLLHVFERVFRLYEESPSVGRHFVKELPFADGPNAVRVNTLTLTFLSRIAELVTRAQERGEVRKDVLPLLAAQSIFGLYFTSLLGWLAGFSSLEGALQSSLAPSFAMLFQGLRAPPEGAPAPRRKKR